MPDFLDISKEKYIYLDVIYATGPDTIEKIVIITSDKTLEINQGFDEFFAFLTKFVGDIFTNNSKQLYKIILTHFPLVDSQEIHFVDVQIAKVLSDIEQTKIIQTLLDNRDFIGVIHTIDKTLPESLKKLWREVESPLVYILAKIELNGVFIDQNKLKDIQSELDRQIISLEQSITQMIDKPININSTKQLGEALAEKGYNLGKKGKSGNLSTDRETLELLIADDTSGLIKKILEYRTYTKLQSGFVVPLLDLVDKKTSRIHTTYDQMIVPTGRISSNSPNLQNIPVKDDIYGKKIRSCFAAEPGNILIGADYSQAELRFLAHFTQDETLLEVFRSGQDIHSRTASEIFEIPLSEVTSSQRRVGKTLNFALLYQQGTFSTAKQLGITTKEAQVYIDKYFARFTKVKPFIEKVLLDGAEKGYVETFSGRRRYFANLKVPNRFLRAMDERAAFNAVLQGSNADITKLAMLHLEKRFRKEKIDYRLVLTVHDELVVEVNEKYIEIGKRILQEEMELGQPLFVPLEVCVSAGKNWAETK
jgi:DNA polymerase I